MTGLVLRLLGGPLGTVILWAVVAVMAALAGAAGLQTWRTHTLRTALAEQGRALATHQGNAERCAVSLGKQNAAVEALHARCADEHRQAARHAGGVLDARRARARELLEDPAVGPAAMNRFMRELYP